jgi:lipopolysaccharide transport system permease protein
MSAIRNPRAERGVHPRRRFAANAPPPGLAATGRELWRHRELLAVWLGREIRVRYAAALLGAGWAVLQPLSLMAVHTVVFSWFVRLPSEGVPYPIFSYVGVLPWTFLAAAVTTGVPSLVQGMNLVTKVYFPREIVPLAAVGACLVDFAIGAFLFAPVLAFAGARPGPVFFWLPALMATLLVLTVALALLGSAANVFFRDVRFVVPLAIQVGLFVSPVVYPLAIVPAAVRPLYVLNPLAGLLDGFRAVLLHGRPPDPLAFGAAVIVSFALLVLAIRVFKGAEREFADVL